MSKKSLVLKYFQKVDQLNIRNRRYCNLLSFLLNWLVQNDQVKNDQTTRLLHLSSPQSAQIISRQEGVIAGLEEISFLLKNLTHLSFQPLVKDGEKISQNQIIAKVSGANPEILAFERTILNILQRLSGIATETNFLIKSLKTKIPPPFIAATRKTPWGLLDKKAVAIGGGLTHRLDLSDGILIKDNHLAAIKKEYRLKTEEEAVARSLEIILSNRYEKATKTPLIEIEIETPDQALVAVKTFQRLNKNHYLAIMFDNFSPPQVKTTIRDLNDLSNLSLIIFEISGGINEKNIKQWAKTGVELLSVGALTHSSRAINLSLEF